VSDDVQQITKKRVVFRLPGEEKVTIRRDLTYRESGTGALTMDIYYPPDFTSGARVPAVVFVSGYSDLGFQKILGCKLKEMELYISWGKLTAASGLIAITYSAVDPTRDVDSLLDFVRQNAQSLSIDENRIGIWSSSGNAPNALSILMDPGRDYVKCAVFCYPLMMDLDGHRETAQSATRFGFVNPCAGKSIDDLRRNTPLIIARSGRDEMPHLNETLDRFLSQAISSNLPVTFTNHPNAPHSFDIMDDTETTRYIIQSILAFMRLHLRIATAVKSS
jgi:hypothetical protein